jgi:hypothetical protein
MLYYGSVCLEFRYDGRHHKLYSESVETAKMIGLWLRRMGIEVLYIECAGDVVYRFTDLGAEKADIYIPSFKTIVDLGEDERGT